MVPVARNQSIIAQFARRETGDFRENNAYVIARTPAPVLLGYFADLYHTVASNPCAIMGLLA